MRKLQIVGLMVAIGTLPIGCALYSNATYSTWNGPSVRTGFGGTKRTVNGIDIWQVGTPPGQYQILGTIAQSNSDDGTPIAFIANMDAEHELVKQARLHGGDAIILIGEDTQVTGFSGGYIGDGAGGGSFYSSTNTRSQKGVAVIKYLPSPAVAPAQEPLAESYMPGQTTQPTPPVQPAP